MSERILRSMYVKMLTEDEASKGLMDVKKASDEAAEGLMDTKKEMDHVTDSMEHAEKAFEDLRKTMETQIAVNLEQTAERLDRVGTNFQRMSTTVMAASDIYEGFGKLMVNNHELLGMTEEQAAKLNETIEHNVRNFMEISRVLMGVGDMFEMTGYFIKQVIPQLASLQVASNATSASMIANIRATTVAFVTSPLGIAILAITAAVALLAIAWKRNWGDIRDVFDRSMGRIFETLNLLGIGFEDFGDVLEWIDNVFHKVFWGIMSVFEEVFNELIDVIQEVIIDIVNPALEELRKAWEEIIAPLQSVFAELGGNKDLLVLVGKIIAYTILAPLIVLVSTLKILHAAWTADWGAIRKDMLKTFTVFEPIINWLISGIETIQTALLSLRDTWTSAMTQMKDSIMGLWEWVSGIISYIAEMFDLFVNLVKAIGELDWARVSSIASEIVSMSPATQLAKYVTQTTKNVSSNVTIYGMDVSVGGGGAEAGEDIAQNIALAQRRGG